MGREARSRYTNKGLGEWGAIGRAPLVPEEGLSFDYHEQGERALMK